MTANLRKHRLDFEGSQAAKWRGRIVEVVEQAGLNSYGEQVVLNSPANRWGVWWRPPSEVTPIGPVARELLVVFRG